MFVNTIPDFKIFNSFQKTITFCKVKTKTIKKSLDYIGFKIWLDVPHGIKLCSFLKSKQQLKLYFMSKYRVVQNDLTHLKA